MVFNALDVAPTPTTRCRKLQEEVAPKLAAHQDAIYLNAEAVPPRSNRVYDQRATLKLDPGIGAAARGDRTSNFVHGRRAAVRRRQDRAQEAERGRSDARARSSPIKLLAATKDGALVVDDKAEAGRPVGRRTRRRGAGGEGRASSTASGCCRCRTPRSSRRWQSLTNRATREQLFKASWTRAEHGDANDTRETIAAPRRSCAPSKAKLLGYPELRRLEARRSDGQDAASTRSSFMTEPGAGRHRQGASAKRRTCRR